MSSINWQDLQQAAADAGFSVLPNDEYDVSVATAEAKKTSTGKDMIAVRFKVESGPHEGQSVFNQFVLSPENGNALGFFFRHMGALGLDKEYFAAMPALTQVAAALVGRRCRVKVSTRVWNDQERNQVDGVMPPVGGPGAPPPSGTGHGVFAPPAGVPGLPGGVAAPSGFPGGLPAAAPPPGTPYEQATGTPPPLPEPPF